MEILWCLDGLNPNPLAAHFLINFEADFFTQCLLALFVAKFSPHRQTRATILKLKDAHGFFLLLYHVPLAFPSSQL